MQTFNRGMSDQEVVAAINSCIDFTKLKELPSNTIERFKCLVKHRRIGAVCFFKELGFGLKVYSDHAGNIGITYDGGDECEVTPKFNNKDWTFNLEGWWLRCPSEILLELTTTIEYQIKDEYGNCFLKSYSRDPNVYEGVADSYINPEWSGVFKYGLLFSEENAKFIAASDKINGIVVKVKPENLTQARREMAKKIQSGWTYEQGAPLDTDDEEEPEDDLDDEEG